MTTERLTQAQLEAIRKRALTSLGRSWYTELIETREDVTLLLAEVERLRRAIYEVKDMTNSGCISCEGVWESVNNALRSDTE